MRYGIQRGAGTVPEVTPVDERFRMTTQSSSSLFDTLMAVNQPEYNIAGLVSGNAAYLTMLENMRRSILRLHKPFPFSWVAVDKYAHEVEGELRRIQAASTFNLAELSFPKGSKVPAPPQLHIYEDKDAISEFRGVSSEQLFRSYRYDLLARYKWPLAQRSLAALSQAGLTDRSVLIFDPDIVFYRNPMPYLAGLPQCDMYFQTEAFGSTWLQAEMFQAWLGPHMMSHTASSRFKDHDLWYLWVNTGFMMFRQTPETMSAVNATIAFFDVIDTMTDQQMKHAFGRNNSRDDQMLFNMLVELFYDLPSAPKKTTGRLDRVIAARTMMQHGSCIELVKVDNMADIKLPFVKDPRMQAVFNTLPRTLNLWLLNSALFPTHRVFQLTELCDTVLEPPYMIHYNWLVGIGEKTGFMKRECGWFL